MWIHRDLIRLACATTLVAGGAGIAQAAPATGLVQAAPALVGSPGAPNNASLIHKAWYHHRWHHWHHHWHHWHHWHHHWHHWRHWHH